MKLYHTTCVHAAGTAHHFDSSASDASKSRTALKTQFPGAKPVSEQKEILQNRDGILHFLNGLFDDAAKSASAPK